MGPLRKQRTICASIRSIENSQEREKVLNFFQIFPANTCRLFIRLVIEKKLIFGNPFVIEGALPSVSRSISTRSFSGSSTFTKIKELDNGNSVAFHMNKKDPVHLRTAVHERHPLSSAK